MSNRQKKRNQILTKLDLLKNEVPSFRTRIMNKEFGPYWYYLLGREDQPIPEELIRSPRYQQWLDDRQEERNAFKREHRARVREFFNNQGAK